MKLFQQKTQVHKFKSSREFIEEFKICKSDFILTSKSAYDTYFKSFDLDAHVEYKSKYGAGEPDDIMMDKLLDDFSKTSCTRIIAIGGGAVIDMAKLLVLKDGKKSSDLFQKKVPLEKVRELIAVPTTCGAGSEVSNISIAEITEMNTKFGLAVDELFPDYAVLIPELLLELPYSFFATSAIDALIHAIESFVSPKASIYTEIFSTKAIDMILNGFQQIVLNGKDYRFDIIEDFLVASDLAGIAFGNAGTGAVHALSYPLSGVYHVTHGEANYQFFIEVFKTYNRISPDGKLAKINMLLSEIMNCEISEVYEKMEELLNKIITRKSLREYGMKDYEINSFADSVIDSQQRLLNQSYVKLNREEIVNIYRTLY